MWYKIKDFYRNVKYTMMNVWYHRDALIHSRPWDYSGTYRFIKDNLTYLSNSIEEYGNSTYKDKGVKQMRICIHLINRLLEDDYSKSEYDIIIVPPDGKPKFTTSFKYDLPKWKGKCAFTMEDKIKQNDKDLLFKLLNKHLHSWWD